MATDHRGGASLDRRRMLGSLGAATLLGTAPIRWAYAQQMVNSLPATTATLRAQASAVALKPSPAGAASLWSFAGDAAGARLTAPANRPLTLTLANALAQPVSLHIQGMKVPNALDGAAPLVGAAIAPGEERALALPPPRPGTYFFRSLSIPEAAEQSARGLYGTLVVPEPEPVAVDADRTIILTDWALDDAGDLRPGFGSAADAGLAGRLGNWLTVNGATPPQTISLPGGGRARLRLVNGANARIFALRFEGMEARVLAIDSIATEPFAPARSALTLLPGGRYDVVVEPREGAVIAGMFGANAVPLITFSASEPPSPHAGTPLPALPAPDLPASIDLAAAARAEAAIGGGLDPAKGVPADADPARLWRVNGTPFADQRAPLLRVPRGRPVVLAFTNGTSFVQALHVHGHHVRLLHPLDDGWEPYWVDTFAVPPGRTVRIAFVADNPGRWLIGSAIIDRLPAGLATWYEVSE